MMSPFEVGMLVCFGASWPVSLGKSIRTRQVAGKSPVFMAIVAFGYACGIGHKLLFARDWVVVLYAINLLMVVADLALYFYLMPAGSGQRPGPGVEPVATQPSHRAESPGRGWRGTKS